MTPGLRVWAITGSPIITTTELPVRGGRAKTYDMILKDCIKFEELSTDGLEMRSLKL
ncbi:hypothetical protein EW026_g1852 [Hermanssonia centrifuga]|uniref:Uncharacterized protein n=1 Tax=Hermanssonia centrifuga TaxID=98765 RepID=A0A4S4KQZ8_9APHY|nr:hypothetical protein EW026_g1852 [Hermanssonia centrifuga]